MRNFRPTEIRREPISHTVSRIEQSIFVLLSSPEIGKKVGSLPNANANINRNTFPVIRLIQ